MPKSKRDKKISLTKTKKKGLAFKQKLVEDIQCNIARFQRIFLFSVDNMRNTHLKDVRAQWKSSRFFFGKVKVMALALGTSVEKEVEKDLHKLSEQLRGQCGLLLTNEEESKVIDWFEKYVEPEFPRSGFKATRTVKLTEGPLMDFKSSMEPNLRKLGLPTIVKLGKTHLRDEHTVCTEGQILDPNQAQILKHLGEYMAEFRVTLNCVWNKDGDFKILRERNNDSTEGKDVEMEDDDD